jgi:membrane-associated PAP2 superfamily phosphatase
MNAIPNFLGGAIVFGYGLIALYFLKFWKRTRDAFFGYFAFAFFILGIGRVIEAIERTNEVDTPIVYLFRLAAFLIIIFAILYKNLSSKK